MEPTWRWFGPKDPISLRKIRQAGATGIVSALHHLKAGELWSLDEILERKQLIETAGLRWSVVESLPVHTDIRLRAPGFENFLERYIMSLSYLGQTGITTICYNFMPVIDWTRTQLASVAADGSKVLRFDWPEWVAFDVMLLRRQGAERDYSAGELEAADASYRRMDDSARGQLIRNVVAGLPGANEAGLTLDTLRAALEPWTDVSPAQLLESLCQFLQAVVPTCERYGIRMCIHPDDPPRPLLGLPRIASTVDDFRHLFSAVTSPVNGITLCAGSLASRLHGDPLGIAREFASRVHFAHLRNVHVEPDGSFTETAHLEGDIDVVDLIKILILEERRRAQTIGPSARIAMRPDHGAALEGDIDVMPGYPWLGRLKGLAELRGVMHAVERMF